MSWLSVHALLCSQNYSETTRTLLKIDYRKREVWTNFRDLSNTRQGARTWQGPQEVCRQPVTVTVTPLLNDAVDWCGDGACGAGQRVQAAADAPGSRTRASCFILCLEFPGVSVVSQSHHLGLGRGGISMPSVVVQLLTLAANVTGNLEERLSSPSFSARCPATWSWLVSLTFLRRRGAPHHPGYCRDLLAGDEPFNSRH
jgi:hypothetical protein